LTDLEFGGKSTHEIREVGEWEETHKMERRMFRKHLWFITNNGEPSSLYYGLGIASKNPQIKMTNEVVNLGAYMRKLTIVTP